MTNDGPMCPATSTPEGSRAARPRRLREVTPGRRGLVLAWFGFTVTFGAMRLLTWLIHIDVGGIGDVSAGGVHIHHYVWGILLLFLVGGIGLVERSARLRLWLGLAYGVGAALVIDEAALLLSLEDVYWDDEGGISIALALLVIGVAGSLLALTRRSDDEEDTGRGRTGTPE